jgi:hypothetical protein
MTSESSSNIDFETFGGLMFYRRNLDRDFQWWFYTKGILDDIVRTRKKYIVSIIFTDGPAIKKKNASRSKSSSQRMAVQVLIWLMWKS